MNWMHLVIKEIRLRHANFTLATLAVASAVAVGLIQLLQLQLHDWKTEEFLGAQRAQLERDMTSLEDDYRKITKELGYNLVILPASQDLGSYYSGDGGRARMPLQYVDRLAKSNLMTIQHLLPIVEEKTVWPEQQNRPIILSGTRGEVTAASGGPKAPLMGAVAPGHVVLGYRLWTDLGVSVGDRVTLKSRPFQVAECLSERGTKEDITIWAALEDVQQLLNCPGQINAMMALKCHCQGNDLPSVRRAVAQVLPDVQVLEIADKSLARGQARDRAHTAALAALADEEHRRAELRLRQSTLANWSIPAAWLSAAAMVGVLVLLNVRGRFSEIGVLRAFGARSRQIALLVLARSLLFGSLGAAVGAVVGLTVFALGEGGAATSVLLRSSGAQAETLVLLAAAPILSLVVAGPAVLLAAHRDPALVLGQE